MSAEQKMPPRTETARGFLSRFGAAIPHLLQPHTDADATTVIHVTTFASNPTAGRASTDGSVAGLLDVERARAELDDALLRVHATLGQAENLLLATVLLKPRAARAGGLQTSLRGDVLAPT